MEEHIKEVQVRYKEFVDVKRKESPIFQIGDKVWLLRRNIKTFRPYDKVDYCKIEPFHIKKQINTIAYQLILPTSMKIHPIFHISLLETYRESNFLKRIQPPPLAIVINDHKEYEVKEILDSRIP